MKRAYRTIMLAGTLSLGFAAACPASGIHKLVDERGHIIFTNDPARNSRQTQSSKTASVISSHRNSTSTGSGTVSITNSNYPRVSKLQQDQRDSKRRQILAQELSNETRLLEDALKTINMTQQKTEDNYLYPYFASGHFDILQLRNQAAAHERNIEALRMELNNL